ncbi:DNA primase [Streptomyces sp. TS71-3]|uniref:DNA primase n=1 Tax=Streptomyces sp. TS71-3 TaxID=2733862 RepID=UPI001B170589|nr:DNA primase [Streptomyces sp. TS71-3]GHJ37819.1 hypothetical protein Sm713_34280 [Streptomyces sp. TS71-3]
MDRTTMGLAVGAGYLLGRSRKMKMALMLGAMAAGRRLPVTPSALKGAVGDQLRNSPHLKGLGDQLGGQLGGLGKAATGALIERRIEGVADRLQSHTAGMRERMAGGGPEGEAPEAGRGEEEGEEPERGARAEEAEEERPRPRPAKKTAKKAAKKAPAKKASTGRAPVRKAPDKRAAGRVPPGKRAAARTAPGGPVRRPRPEKGGGDRG